MTEPNIHESELPSGYHGRILKSDCSDGLRKRILECITGFSAFEKTGIPAIPYLSAWFEGRESIWYEYIGQRLQALLDCHHKDIAQVFRDSIVERSVYKSIAKDRAVTKEIQSPLEVQSARQKLRQESKQEGTTEAIYKIKTCTDDHLWLKDRAVTEFFKQDGICISLGGLVDITSEMITEDRFRQAEAALRESEARLSEILRGSPIPTFVINHHHEVINWNRACANLTGYSAESMVGSRRQWIPFYSKRRPTLADLILDQVDESVIADHYQGQCRRSELYEGAFEVELFFEELKDSPKWLFLMAAPLRDHQGNVAGAIETLQDMTAQKQAENELKAANQRIIEQQQTVVEKERLNVLLQMAGATAHELNQPLTALLGNIDLIKMSRGNPENLDRYINSIEEAGQRISRIVKNIQSVRHDQTKPYSERTSIIKIDQTIGVLYVTSQQARFEQIKSILSDYEEIELERAATFASVPMTLKEAEIDLLIIDERPLDGGAEDMFDPQKAVGGNLPVLVIQEAVKEDQNASDPTVDIYDGLAQGCLSAQSLFQSITEAIEKHRAQRQINDVKEEIAQMTTIDELTGLYNRQYFMEALDREFARSNRYGIELVLCVLEIHHPQSVGQAESYSIPDVIIAESGEILKGCFRHGDLICRFDDTQFAVLLTHTKIQDAKRVCERVRLEMAQQPFDAKRQPDGVTISIGIVPFLPDNTPSIDILLALAGQALLLSKSTGENQVVDYPTAFLSRKDDR